MSVLGERIKLRRAELGMSQENLAKVMGTYATQISRYENGDNDPTAQVILRFAEALKVTPNWLLGVSDIMFSSDMDDQERELLKLYHSKNPESQKKMLELAKLV